MFKQLKIRRGSSIIEYMVVVLFLLATLFIFQNYIVRGFAGRWKSIADTYGGGRQYDPKDYAKGGTLECFYYDNSYYDTAEGNWIATRCYESCLGDLGAGDEDIMSACRVSCNENLVAYRDCRNTDYQVDPLR